MYKLLDPSLGFVLVEDGPLVLATTALKDQKDVCCLSWTMVLSFASGNHNIALCTGSWNRTYDFMKESGEITINIPVKSQFKQAVLTGSVSIEEGIDKFQKFGLKTIPGIQNKCPILKGCAGFLECRFATEYLQDNIVILDTVNVGIDPIQFKEPRIHAVGDGSFTFDGEIANGRKYMGGKIPENTLDEEYLKLIHFPKRTRKVSDK